MSLHALFLKILTISADVKYSIFVKVSMGNKFRHFMSKVIQDLYFLY